MFIEWWKQYIDTAFWHCFLGPCSFVSLLRETILCRRFFSSQESLLENPICLWKHKLEWPTLWTGWPPRSFFPLTRPLPTKMISSRISSLRKNSQFNNNHGYNTLIVEAIKFGRHKKMARFLKHSCVPGEKSEGQPATMRYREVVRTPKCHRDNFGRTVHYLVSLALSVSFVRVPVLYVLCRLFDYQCSAIRMLAEYWIGILRALCWYQLTTRFMRCEYLCVHAWDKLKPEPQRHKKLSIKSEFKKISHGYI